MSEEVTQVEETTETPVEAQAEETTSMEAQAEEVTEQGGEEGTAVMAETDQELEQEIEQAIDDGATEEEVKDMIRQYTLKVDGKEIVREIDLNNEEEIKKQLQLALKGQKSTQELAELKRAYEQGIQSILKDPLSVLKDLDPDFDPLKVSSDFIEKEYKAKQMSPEEREAIQRQKEYEQLKEERDRLMTEKEEAQKSVARKQLADEIQEDILSALEGDTELIVDRETVALVAEELIWAAKNNYEVSAADVLPTVKEKLRRQFENSANRFKSTDVLKKYMGSSLLDRLREERIEQAKQQVKSVNNIKSTANSVKAEPEKKEQKKLSLSDFMGR